MTHRPLPTHIEKQARQMRSIAQVRQLGAALVLCLGGIVCGSWGQANTNQKGLAIPKSRSSFVPPQNTDKHNEARELYLGTTSAFLLEGNRPAARAGYVQVTKIDPTYSPAWFNLGVFAEADKNWALARSCFSRYIQVAPNGRDALRARAQIALLAKYEAGQVPASSAKNADYDAMIQRARTLMANGLFRESIAETGQAQVLNPSRWEAYAVASLCMARQHRVDEAVKLQKIALEHAPASRREQIQDTLAKKTAEWNP